MTVNEIKESGLLEYYVLGLLSEQEARKVEGYLVQYPELKEEYLEIQRATQGYASAKGVRPNASLEQSILKNIREQGDKTPIVKNNEDQTTAKKNNEEPPFNMFKQLSLFVLGALSIFSIWYAFQKNNEIAQLQNDYNIAQIECDSLINTQNDKLQMYEQLNTPSNKTIPLTPTPGYPATDLLFHLNTAQRQNFIQVKNLPDIATNQAFQLWSLKDGQNPIPLTVFKSGNSFIIPVDFEENTATYAITIEDEEGAQVPTLTRLIGTISTT